MTEKAREVRINEVYQIEHLILGGKHKVEPWITIIIDNRIAELQAKTGSKEEK